MKLLTCTSALVLALLGFVQAGAGGDNTSPPGFKSLFNGKDLTGWKGKQPNWKVVDGGIVYDGKAGDLATDRKDFEKGGDSGETGRAASGRDVSARQGC